MLAGAMRDSGPFYHPLHLGILVASFSHPCHLPELGGRLGGPAPGVQGSLSLERAAAR